MRSYSTLPPGLYRSRPRPTRLSAAGRVLAGVAIALCLAAPAVGIGLNRMAAAEYADRKALLELGVVTEGVVTRLKRESKEDKRAMVYYRFEADGRTVEDRAKIPFRLWSTLSVGSALPIRYLAGESKLNVPDGVIPSVMPLTLGFFIGPLLLVIAVICGVGLKKQHGLLSEGRAALATITKVKKHRGQHGSYYQVGYTFALLNGAEQTGSIHVTAKPPEVTSSIVVLYDAENPRRSRPYPLSLVQLSESD
jgi:hypothetical protein